MNYLAHAALAEPTDEARLGSILGDFARGLEEERLPEATRYALEEHRALDRWFDARDDVRAARMWFPANLRRVSGILLDVFVDHFLSRDFTELAPRPLKEVTTSLYRSFRTYEDLLPPRLASIAPRIAEQDWLSGYGERRNIQRALAGLELRMKRHTGIESGIDLLDERFDDLRALTHSVMPEAYRWAGERRARDGRPSAPPSSSPCSADPARDPEARRSS